MESAPTPAVAAAIVLEIWVDSVTQRLFSSITFCGMVSLITELSLS
jgi:hypothetical protein